MLYSIESIKFDDDVAKVYQPIVIMIRYMSDEAPGLGDHLFGPNISVNLNATGGILWIYSRRG